MTGPRLATVDRGNGPPVLLLHGQPGTGASWAPVTDILAGGFRVLAPDRVGYGASPGEARGMAANADVLAGMLDGLGTGPVTAVGHSWSGGVAVLLADRRPDLVRSLVLVGAACTPDSVDVLDRLLVLPVIGDILTVGGLLALGELLPALRRWAPRMPVRVRDQLLSALPDQGVLGGERGALGRHRRTFRTEQVALLDELSTVYGTLGRIRVPTAVVVGEWDVVVRPAASRTLAAAIPGAELIDVPRAGHFVARDAAVRLAQVVARYGSGDRDAFTS